MTSNKNFSYRQNSGRKGQFWAIIIVLLALAFIGITLRQTGMFTNIIDGNSNGGIANQNDNQTSGSLSGQVLQVKDGDSFTMQIDANNQFNASQFVPNGQIEVRLASIDAPEYFQPYGHECRRELSYIIEGQTISINPQTQDKYGRTVAIAYIDSVNVNREIVRRGCAWAYRQYLSDRAMLGLEQDARNQKIGLWSQDPSKIKAPWLERRQH